MPIKFRRMTRRKTALILFGVFSCSAAIQAFELLSEGAMDSVSAVSVESVDDIINIAGSPAAGLSDDYEALPFQTNVKVGVADTDEVQTELDFKLTQEVQAWAEDLRQQGEFQFEVGVVEELPPSFSDSDPFILQNNQIVIDDDPDARERRDIEEENRVTRRFELLDSGVDSITFQFERVVERAATINANQGNINSSLGSGFVTNSRSLSTQVYSNYRNADKPLFSAGSD